ncbi:MAG TPA: GGDEF domain-containing protein [Firmicutes bacterium]|jgi:diguanylate cyclase (GGDEF)-like protein|nr:GGDEF domain-containing protein [Bacillota bacterium]
MEQQRAESLQRAVVFLTAAAALVLGVVFFKHPGWQDWPVMLALGAVFLYLQTVMVRIGERADYSLATASIFPIIYLYGITPAMVISALAGLADGSVHKKQCHRVVFNASQLPLAALTSALIYRALRFPLGTSGLGGVTAMVAGAVVYTFVNILLVSRMVSIWRGVGWWSQTRILLARSFRSSLSAILIGLVFTFFVKSYGFWGVVGFGCLLMNLSGMLKAAVEVSSERARRKELEEELVIDEMTGAYNFRFLNQWLHDSSGETVTVLFFDIDDYSVFNNTYGHAEGDRVLRMLVETIKQSVRPQDKVIRYGGDEFVVVLEDIGVEGGTRVAERIMGNIRNVKGTHWSRPITVSVGVASKPAHTTDKHQLLLFSDQAMYAAKEAGKDRLRIWNRACAEAAAYREDPC